jgi:excisionase family DNA binding protein
MRMLRVWQIARRIGCCPRHVANLIDSGKLEGFRLAGSRHRRCTEEALEKYLEKCGYPRKKRP